MGGTFSGRAASAIPGLDVSEQRAWENFLEAGLRIYGSLNRTLSDGYKLSLVDVRLLEILNKSETGSARMGDLAGQLLSLPSRVTRQIRRLEEAGLVRREASPDDGRGVLASITDRGRKVVLEAMAAYSDAIQQRFLQPLTRSQVQSIGDNCRRLSDALKTNAPPRRKRRRS